MRMFILSMGSPDCKDIETGMVKFILTVPDSLPLLAGFGGMDDL